MRTFDFDLIIDRDPTGEGDLDRLFEAFDPAGFTVTPGVSSGVPLISCHVAAADLDAPTLDGAMRRAIALAVGCGFAVARVEVEPEALAEAA